MPMCRGFPSEPCFYCQKVDALHFQHPNLPHCAPMNSDRELHEQSGADFPISLGFNPQCWVSKSLMLVVIQKTTYLLPNPHPCLAASSC